jgi:hypothetical protein
MLQYVVPLELFRSRGVARLSTGLPLSSGLSGGKVRCLPSLAVSAGTTGTAAVEAGKEWPARSVQKLARRVGEKRSGQLFSCSWHEGAETRGPENETRSGAGRSRRWVVAGLAAVPALGGRPLHCGLLGLASALVQGLSRLTEMIWFQVPTWMVKERCMAQDSVWAILGLLQGRYDATAVHPDKGGAQEAHQELL